MFKSPAPTIPNVLEAAAHTVYQPTDLSSRPVHFHVESLQLLTSLPAWPGLEPRKLRIGLVSRTWDSVTETRGNPQCMKDSRKWVSMVEARLGPEERRAIGHTVGK